MATIPCALIAAIVAAEEFSMSTSIIRGPEVPTMAMSAAVGVDEICQFHV